MHPSMPARGSTKGGTMKTISAIATDSAFKTLAVMSCFGLALSFSLMAAGMDLSAVAL